MTARAKLRGHDIECVEGQWIYSDLSEPTVNNERDCNYCGLENTLKGHDGCLGTLPGIMNACCGHGQTNEAYLQFWNGDCVRGYDAISLIAILKQVEVD
ncbi:hypothetical protein [Alkalibacillus salilacus]|uniref:Uncharacterized protein n=1 Tax=Alkalibacillus salilacus TaxID=284582 RepID=A0ABT9VDI4_9BACI|nr:hypothetical protein [Alkalibacillus salilacus]MDQ0158986.1 hypothetical protein [Alkalibacillus salilacus]